MTIYKILKLQSQAIYKHYFEYFTISNRLNNAEVYFLIVKLFFWLIEMNLKIEKKN